MSLLQTYFEAFESGDTATLEEILHDEARFIPHVGNAEVNKAGLISFAGTDAVRIENPRILYENDEVGVDHCIAHFANGSTSEAVLTYYRFKDGKIFRMETGATPLSEDYNFIVDSSE